MDDDDESLSKKFFLFNALDLCYIKKFKFLI